ncbi:hypothetical protein QOZ80_6BG0478150 [Eleusine coracana subsp. coracana]|nr:hypothetical protein QOZ80_6BG0478150 [Eleusine coracana subsp. coracana]
MGIHKVILALAVAMLVTGQLAAKGVVLEERQATPVSDGAMLTALGPPKSTLPVHGDNPPTAAGFTEDKGIISPRVYFIPPILPPCRRKTC